MLYLIGLGLNEKSVSKEALEIIKKCKAGNIYLDAYTIEFPYSFDKLRKSVGKKIIKLERKELESEELIKKAKKENICLMVYGSPLFATTHISLLMDCRENKIRYEIIYSASVFDAVGESGLELYKFGKVSSMPSWNDNYIPDSFLDYVKQNRKISAHSIILIDIGLDIKEALEQLIIASKKKDLKIKEIVVCSKLGSKDKKIYYGNIEKLKKKRIQAPFCFIVPGKLHFIEEESLKSFRV